MESAWEIMHEVDVELARDIADRIDESESRNNSSTNSNNSSILLRWSIIIISIQ